MPRHGSRRNPHNRRGLPGFNPNIPAGTPARRGRTPRRTTPSRTTPPPRRGGSARNTIATRRARPPARRRATPQRTNSRQITNNRQTAPPRGIGRTANPTTRGGCTGNIKINSTGAQTGC